MKFDWLVRLISLAPVIVAAIDKIHAGVSGSTKLELAQQSLVLASGVAQAVLPEDAETIAAAGTVSNAVINATVSHFNASGVFQHSDPTPAPIAPPKVVSPDPVASPGLHNTVAN